MSKRVLHEVQIDHQKLIDRHPSHRKRMTRIFPDPNSSHLADSATFHSRFSVGDVNRKQSQDHSVRGQLFGFRFFGFWIAWKGNKLPFFVFSHLFPRYIFNFWAKKTLPLLLPVVWYYCFSSRKCLWKLSDPTKGSLIISWWLYQQGLFYCSRMNAGIYLILSHPNFVDGYFPFGCISKFPSPLKWSIFGRKPMHLSRVCLIFEGHLSHRMFVSKYSFKKSFFCFLPFFTQIPGKMKYFSNQIEHKKPFPSWIVLEKNLKNPGKSWSCWCFLFSKI